VYVHADMESLYKNVPKRILPLEYGGEAGSLQELKGKSYIYWCPFKQLRRELHRELLLTLPV
jgi:hypothetical protein